MITKLFVDCMIFLNRPLKKYEDVISGRKGGFKVFLLLKIE